jgi:hypothetical protein
MALFELDQNYGEDEETEWKMPTFKDFIKEDLERAFFCEDEFAEWHIIDGKKCLVVVEEEDVRQHSAHWEAGAKQNFDTGLYDSHIILHIRTEDYGPKPKVGKQLVMDAGTKMKRTYIINNCEEESGTFRMTLGRIRQ